MILDAIYSIQSLALNKSFVSYDHSKRPKVVYLVVVRGRDRLASIRVRADSGTGISLT